MYFFQNYNVSGAQQIGRKVWNGQNINVHIFFFQNYDVSEGPPPIGAKVWVKWTDGDLYGATFRGVKNHSMYTVSFYVFNV